MIDFLGRQLNIGDYVGYTVRYPKSAIELGIIRNYFPPTKSQNGNGIVIIKRVHKRNFGKKEFYDEFPCEGKELVKIPNEEVMLYILQKDIK